MEGVLQFGAKGDEAGTQVQVKLGGRPVVSSQFGATALAGAFEKGPVGRVIGPLSKSLADRRLGGLNGGFVADVQAPIAKDLFFMKAGDAGTNLYALRLTDGNERQAVVLLLDRNVDPSYGPARACPSASLPHVIGRILAANGGRWGGMGLQFGGKVADVAAAINSDEFDTGLRKADGSWGYKKNELAGLSFNLQGETRTWVIASNTDDGVIVVVGDLTGVTATDGRWRVRGENVDVNGAPRGLAVAVRDGTQDPEAEFALRVFENRRTSRGMYDRLSIDPSAESFYQTLIRESADLTQFEVTATDAASGVDPEEPRHRPANFAEITVPGGASGNSVRFRILNFVVPTGKNPIVSALVDGGAMVPHKYVCTVKTGATGFTVAAYDLGGTRLLAAGLVDGTLGAAYASPHPHLAGFTLTNGTSAMVAGETVTIYVRPLPVSAAGRGQLADLGGWFYPFAYKTTGAGGKNVSTRYRVTANTYDTITLGPADDVSTVVEEPGLPGITGSTAWDATKDTTGKTLIFERQGAAPVTVTLTGGATKTVEQTRDEINADLGAVDKILASVVTAGGHKYLRVAGAAAADSVYGPAATLKLTTGTLNAVAGYADNSTATGANPTVGRLEWNQELEAGRDGVADLADAHYLAAFDIETSPLRVLRNRAVGCLKFAAPGVTDADVVNAGLTFGLATGFVFRFEVPSTIVGADCEAACAAWLRANILTPTDLFDVTFPSWGYLRVNPFGNRNRFLASTTGAILGIEARIATEKKGPHVAACGPTALLSPEFSSLVTDEDNGEAIELNNGVLQENGIQECRHRGTTIVLWGDRFPGENWRWGYAHKRNAILHVARDLLVNGDRLVFSPIGGPLGDSTRSMAMMLSHELLRPKFRAGWFRGPRYEDGVTVACDDATNQDAGEGQLITEVGVAVVGCAEQVIFRLGDKGIGYVGGMR